MASGSDVAPLVGLRQLRQKFLMLAAVFLAPAIALLVVAGLRGHSLQNQIHRLHDTGAHVQAQIIDESNHRCEPQYCSFTGELVVPAPAGPFRLRIGHQPYLGTGAVGLTTATYWYDPAHPDRGTYFDVHHQLVAAGDFPSDSASGLPVGLLVGVAVGLALLAADSLRLWLRVLVAGSMPRISMRVAQVDRTWPFGVLWARSRVVLESTSADTILGSVVGARRSRLTVGDPVLLAKQGLFGVMADERGRVLGVAEAIKPRMGRET